MTRWGMVYPRIGRWLGGGLRQIGAPADIVFLEGPKRLTTEGCVQEVRLGVGHARSALPALVAYLRERQPAMTLATPGPIGSLAVLAGMITGCPVVPWVSTIPRLDNRDISLHLRPHRVLSHPLYSRAALVAAVSGGVRDALAIELARWVPSERIVVIPNPVDTEEIQRRADPQLPRAARLRFCSVGRLVSAKGFDVLIEAFAVARLDRPWELLIIGDGPLRPELEQLVRQRRLEDNVQFRGMVENPYPLMASSDIAVQASRWEGFGMAIVEALSLGVAQIATECPGGIAETLGHGDFGLLVPPGDVQQLASCLRLLATDDGLRQRLAASGPSRAAEYAPTRVAHIVVQMANDIQTKKGAATNRQRD